MEVIRSVMVEILEADHPMTVRQVFYQLVARRAIPKTEVEYKTTVCRLLVEMRRSGRIPYGWIADNTRWMRNARTWDSVEELLRETAQVYRRNLWTNADEQVEVWIEKEALAGVVSGVTVGWHVPLMVTRGYPSVSYVYEAATAAKADGRSLILYYLGDHDPSGVDIDRFIGAEFARHGVEDFEIRRLAVTPEQITSLTLPTRPTKRTDTRAAGFRGESVELDAIPASSLREIVEDAITAHLDGGRVDAIREIEHHERQQLLQLVKQWGAA